jgi:hypothetical protein
VPAYDLQLQQRLTTKNSQLGNAMTPDLMS